MAQNKTNFVGRPCGPQLFLNCRATFQDDLTEVLGITSSRKAEHIIIPASKTNYSTFKKMVHIKNHPDGILFRRFRCKEHSGAIEF